MKKSILKMIFGLVLMILILGFPVFGQDGTNNNGSPKEAEPKTPHDASYYDEATLETLKTLITIRNDLKEQLKTKTHERQIATHPDEISDLTKSINQLNEKIKDTDNDIALMATRITPDVFSEKTQQKFDWQDEVQNLIKPLFHQLKAMTEKPRQIEDLRAAIERYEKQLQTAKQAIDNVNDVIGKIGEDEGNVRKEIDQLKVWWMNKEKLITDQLNISRYQLNEILKSRESLLSATQNFVKSFFKSRGRNFILAIASFFLSFFLIRYLFSKVRNYILHHKSDQWKMFIRILDVGSLVFTFVFSIGAMVFVLYVSGDWFLLSLAIIFLIGLAWTAKEGIPLFSKQIQLMLNLGTVRENERIIYNGVPWRVKTLNLQATLENPCLKPAMLRLPLKEMFGMNSRGYDPNEPWFPSKIGDWLILTDGTHGEVTSQTAEIVQLKLRGGSVKTYLTPNFLGMTPLNISNNFRLKVIFGFDYNHQAIITEEIPSVLTEYLNKSLTSKGYGEDIIHIKTEVEAAGNSSLDLVIIADFNGRAAPLYNALNRAIQKYTIEACTANSWGIPFPQLTVHTPERACSKDA